MKSLKGAIKSLLFCYIFAVIVSAFFITYNNIGSLGDAIIVSAFIPLTYGHTYLLGGFIGLLVKEMLDE